MHRKLRGSCQELLYLSAWSTSIIQKVMVAKAIQEILRLLAPVSRLRGINAVSVDV